MKYKKWTKVKWDGNSELNHWCYRKSFTMRNGATGSVSVGIGCFNLICYSYGANSVFSCSSTRWRKDGAITEGEAMSLIDKKRGVWE